MRLPSSCGCDARRQVIFTDGKLGATEGVVVAAVIVTLIIVWRLNK